MADPERIGPYRVIRRLGAGGEIRRAAELYLERFPTGFRRAEVERLANQLRTLP